MLNNQWNRKRLFSLYIPALIAVVYLSLAIASVQYDDVTYDESPHLRYGIQILKGNTDRNADTEKRFRSTMPVTALNALPRAAEQVLHPGTNKTDWGVADIKNGRYITILFTLLLLLYCFRFSAALSSDGIGCMVMLIIAVDPNILAHSRLVTTDIYSTSSFIATLFHLWKWLAKKESRHFYYWCIAIAIAQCCKPNNILLYAISLLPRYSMPFGQQLRAPFLRILTGVLVFVLLQIIIINALFLFAGSWNSLGQLPLKSDFFRAFREQWIAKIPLPLPKAYISSFDLVQYERETFDGAPLNYLLGELRYKKGFAGYYLVCYMLKTPLVTIALTLAGILYSCIIKRVRKEALLFGYGPCLLMFLFLSTSSIQNGYRYLLPLACLSVIFSASFLLEAVRRAPLLSLACFSFIPVADRCNGLPELPVLYQSPRA